MAVVTKVSRNNTTQFCSFCVKCLQSIKKIQSDWRTASLALCFQPERPLRQLLHAMNCIVVLRRGDWTDLILNNLTKDDSVIQIRFYYTDVNL